MADIVCYPEVYVPELGVNADVQAELKTPPNLLSKFILVKHC